jgi:hypothetical protein
VLLRHPSQSHHSLKLQQRLLTCRIGKQQLQQLLAAAVVTAAAAWHAQQSCRQGRRR